ncbi:MAG TPA: bifunctional transaldolase/phosoglucose isomerase [Thermomicrobiales bacterium]|nr:bifunctional transaldolase/phosoglucose isomerase [Thermomicrobiales bacterium]
MTEKNPLQRLADFGQSVWNDNLSRRLITSGELQSLIDNDGIVGITSNPTIFDAAISQSDDYEEQIRELVQAGRSAEEILEALMITDIQMACDILRPIYDATNGVDGVVSLEVSPLLAHNTEETLSEARRLNKLVDRENVMIKIPGTEAGIPAIEQALYEGININITLLFSLDAYRDVMEAYLTAMERRLAEGKPLDNVLSVASFFVSRVDTEVDKRLQAIIDEAPDSERAKTARALLGQVAIANARLAYQEFKKVFGSRRFAELAGHGARIQRPLWASTSTKNPDYPDTLYVDELIGPNTVQTLAPASIEAFRDHGTVALTVEKDIDLAADVIREMESLGIAYDDVIDVLVREGVEKFAESHHSLLRAVETEVERISAELRGEREAALGELAESTGRNLDDLGKADAVAALRNLDGSFWSEDAATAREIAGWLGWLMSPAEMLAYAELGCLDALTGEVNRRGYQRVVLLGMGGSSLAPEVMAATLDTAEGAPQLTVLDSTHPDTIARVAERMAEERTLFVVSSKSGTTIETATLFEYFLDQKGGNPDDFIIITDPGTPLEAAARHMRAWQVFTNRHDIGGRFSALSYFGLVPAAAAGIDTLALLRDAASVMPIHDVSHPGIVLGAALAAAREAGRDKLTLITSPRWAPFGDWLEQLIAESTGKHGTGIVPVAREPLRGASGYGSDRFFAVIDDGDPDVTRLREELVDAGHPVISFPARLGQLFLIWEIATAVVGQRLGINPFDQPNVQEAKDQTNRVLKEGVGEPIEALDPASAVQRVMAETRENEYVAIQAFVDATDDVRAGLDELRAALASATGAATTLGIGPRFLHSTGQLHKGGPATGVFLQVVQEPARDLEIPGREFGFKQLFSAQADGDYLALKAKNLRVLRVTLGSDAGATLKQMAGAARGAAVAAD